MTVMEYMAKLTELAHFAGGYMAKDVAKVRKFEDGLKLSIWGKIVGFLPQDMDSLVRMAMTIESDIDDAWSIQDLGSSDKRKEGQSSSSSGKKQKASSSRGFQGQGYSYQGQGYETLISGGPIDNPSTSGISVLGHFAPKSWYRTGTNYPWTLSYLAQLPYVPSLGPIRSYLNLKYEKTMNNYSS